MQWLVDEKYILTFQWIFSFIKRTQSSFVCFYVITTKGKHTVLIKKSKQSTLLMCQPIWIKPRDFFNSHLQHRQAFFPLNEIFQIFRLSSKIKLIWDMLRYASQVRK